MLKQTTFSLLLLQLATAFGADYTLPEVEKKLNDLQIIPLTIPDGIPHPAKINYSQMSQQDCRKCGGKYQLSSEYQGIMAANLLERLQKLAGEKYTFAWDESKICPRCSEGRLYLRIGKQSYRFNPEVKTDRGKVEEFYAYRSVPVGFEDLIEIFNFFKDDPNAYGLRAFFDGCSFVVATEEQFSQNMTNNKMGGEDKKNFEKIKAEKKLIGESYQQLTEQATVLRKKDLAGMLKKIDTTPNLSTYKPQYLMLTRRLISADGAETWTSLKCPDCGKEFFVLNGSNSPNMQPLSHLLAILKKFDVEADYGSLCPYCHPETEAARQLEVKFNFADQQIKARLSPDDLELIYACFIEHYNFEDNKTNKLVIPVQMSRLQDILLGKSAGRMAQKSLSK